MLRLITHADGVRQVSFPDPDGYRIEVDEPVHYELTSIRKFVGDILRIPNYASRISRSDTEFSKSIYKEIIGHYPTGYYFH